MNNPHIYTAMIDVLAYRSRLEQDISSGDHTFKNDLEGALTIFDAVNSAVYGVQAISDTIIMTCSTHDNFPEFLGILKSVFLKFMEKGLFIRGGVAYARHFQSGRLTYSHAVTKAHELESKSAIYPRIVIDNNIIQMYMSSKTLPDIFDRKLLAEHNETHFLNVATTENWNTIYNHASQMYKKDNNSLIGNEPAFAKHQWFENYLFSLDYADPNQERYINKMTII